MSNYFLGGDVSKGYADFVILNDQKEITENTFQLDDTFEGHQKLFSILKQFFENHTDAVLYAGVESTGGYENNWFNALLHFSRELPLYVTRLNPTGVKHNTKAAMRRVTNDAISAFHIAEYQIHHPEKLHYNEDDQFKTLKRLVTTTAMMVKTRTQFLNELETLLYMANPELIIYNKNKIPTWLLKLLLLYPDAHSLAMASVEDLVKIPYLAPTRAREIIKSAQNSVASATDDITRLSITSLVSSIISLDTSINNHVKIMQKYMTVPQVKLLCSIKGVGVSSAIGLLIEIGCIERFPTVKHLASFFGLHPVYKKSGDGTYEIKMSKQGRRRPRAILYMVILNAIQSNPLIKDVYLRERRKGKEKMDAIGVCMHKMLRIIYGMLKNDTLFDPEIDRKNQKRSVKTKKVDRLDNKRRFQLEDANAPISRRQTKTRKERELSQSDNITVNEIDILAPCG